LGLSVTVQFEIVVAPQPVPINPAITSHPIVYAEGNTLYQYQVTVSDTSNTPDSYSLLSGPAGMSINANTGLLTWTAPAPTNQTSDVETVTLAVSNLTGGQATQTYTLTVPYTGCAITSTPPPGPVVVGQTYTYNITAIGNVNFYLSQGGGLLIPNDSTFTVTGPDSATFTWTPIAARVGTW
jgi:large repetitive protein